MAIFPNLELEDVVQVNDKTRLNAAKSFVSKDEEAITLIEIEPEASAGYVDVTATAAKNWFLDWEYATAGAKVVSCRVTTDGSPTIKTFSLTVTSAADDKLFSADADLVALEHDILRYVPDGRNSFKNVHRKAQSLIVAWLDENGHTDSSGNRLTKDAIIDLEEVRYWSAALAMSLIFKSISNAVDDVFQAKAIQYDSMAITHRNRLIIRLDVTGDGIASIGEGINVKSLDMVRR
jgi:hypothetical protein